MNDILQKFARDYIRDRVAEFSQEKYRRTFRLMYGRNGMRRSTADALMMSIDDIVAEIPEDKLDWCMIQVERTPRLASSR